MSKLDSLNFDRELNSNLTPTEVAGNYGTVPEDPKYYVETSRMAQQPELELWDFIENRPDKEWEEYAMSTGADLDSTYEAKPYTNLDLDHHDFYDWMMANQDICQKKYYEKRPYHNGINEFTLDLPIKVGYNHRNTIEYNWGLYGNSNEELKELMGGREAFEQIGYDYDSALCRLLAYMPGQVLPLHFDYLGGWCRENAHLNPNMDTRSCDIGEIRRCLIAITPWHWGHMLQFANSWFPNWESGDVYDLPIPIYHLSANAGIKLKLTMTISGAVTNDNWKNV